MALGVEQQIEKYACLFETLHRLLPSKSLVDRDCITAGYLDLYNFDKFTRVISMSLPLRWIQLWRRKA